MTSAQPTRPSTAVQESDRRTHAISRRTALLYGVGITLAAGLPFAAAEPAIARASASASRRLTLPAPTGHLRLGTVSLHLIDYSRRDPWVPSIPFRELMIQIWYPAQAVYGYPRAPYTSTATARVYEKQIGDPVPLNWPITHAYLGAPVQRVEDGWPVILYSHSLGGERFETTCLVEELASRGYVVVTIDHVHDAGVVELPDGHLEITAVPQLPDEGDSPATTKMVESRVADVRFVLDQLTLIDRGGNPDHEHRPLPRGLGRALDLGRVGMFGQSDGGSTTAHAIHADARIRAGVNLDGTLWTPQAVDGSNHALLLFGRQDLDSFEAATWAKFWKKQRGPKLQLNLKGSLHGTFTDFAALVPQAASILGEPPSWVAELIGTINGPRAVTVERTYISAWFDTYLRHHHSPLLTGPSPRYPEVVFAH